MKIPLTFDLPSPLAVVCHDAGAANVIFAWLRRLATAGASDTSQWRLLLDGPARQLWRANPVVGVMEALNLAAALDGARVLLSGTGWASELEHCARISARNQQIHSVAVIDHWSNYAMRFERCGQVALPDELWVTDQYAANEARRCFPATPVRQHPNLYLQEAVNAIRPLQERDDGLLYLLEPIRANWAEKGGGEFQVLDYFVANMRSVTGNAAFTFRLRPHPSDPPGKYDSWILRHLELGARLDDSQLLSDAISRARWVVGAESFAMVVALTAGRTVLSTLPPWAHRCRLPHSEIIHLRDYLPNAEDSAK